MVFGYNEQKIRCRINQGYIKLPTGKEIFDAILGDMYVLSTKKY